MARQQFSHEYPFDSESEARVASRPMAVGLIEQAKNKGFSDFQAPPKPRDFEIWDVFCECRILIKYIVPSPAVDPSYWDKFLCRVDTTGRQA